MKNYIQPLIILLLVACLFKQCNEYNSLSARHERNIEALNDTTSYYKNKLGQEVATKLSLELTKKELNKKLSFSTSENKRLSEALKKMKKPIVIVQSDQEVKIDTIKIPVKSDIDCQFFFNENVKKDWFSFSVSGNNKSLLISDFELKNSQTLVFGYKKKNFFSNPELRAEITNTNPYLKQKNIKPIYIVYKRSWYEKPIYTIPIGFVLGYGLTKL